MDNTGELDPARSGQGRTFGLLAELGYALRDGLIALGAAIVVALLGFVVVFYSAGGHAKAGPGDFFAVAVWLTGASLGVPVHGSDSLTLPAAGPFASGVIELRGIVWLLTAIVLVLVFRLVRRRVRAHPGAGLAWRARQAVATALAVTIILLVLALITTTASVFGVPPSVFGEAGQRSSSSIGMEPAFVFAGPLLLTAIAALAGAASAGPLAGTVPAGPAVGAAPAGPLASRLAGELARWRPVAGLAWRQLAVTGALTGVTLLVYLSVEVGLHGTGRETAAVVVALVFLLPDLAILGTFGGFGTTVYGTLTTSPVTRYQQGTDSVGYGLFGSNRPWIVWLLLASAVAGTVAGALLASRAATRSGHPGGASNAAPDPRPSYPVAGVWRATVTGLVAAVAVVLLGAFSYSISTFAHAATFIRTDGSAGPSLLAAAGLTAAWLSLGYLVASLASRRGTAYPSGTRLASGYTSG